MKVRVRRGAGQEQRRAAITTAPCFDSGTATRKKSGRGTVLIGTRVASKGSLPWQLRTSLAMAAPALDEVTLSGQARAIGWTPMLSSRPGRRQWRPSGECDGFAELFDGFSIGSNDLTQLTLGVDRDSAIVAFDFDERDPGMLEMLRLADTGAKRNRRHVGICGEAPADYPEIAQFLARLGIDSISVTAASVLHTMSVVHEAEQQAAGAP